jgi:Flp pilus assembly protein TadG
MGRSAARCRRLQHRTGRRGTAALEFAIILPLLITIVLGCIDFGRFAYTYIGVTNAARVGAGIGALNPVSSDFSMANLKAEILAAVKAELGSRFDASKIVLADPVVTLENDGQKRVRVEVGYPFQTLVSWPLLPSNLDLRRAVEMRVIR